MKLISVLPLLALATSIIATPIEDVSDVADINYVTDVTDTTGFTETTANDCSIGDNVVFFSITVNADNVDNIGDVCNRFFGGLKQQGCAPTNRYCAENGGSKHLLAKWRDSRFCNKRKVEGAWYAATGNRFGTITCR